MGIIYCAVNKLTGEIYIGKTFQSLQNRKTKHRRDTKKGSTFHFHRAINKYGWENFGWKVLDQSDCSNELSILEQVYIDMFSSGIPGIGYNMTLGGGLTGWHHSDQTKTKIRESEKGKSVSQETRQKLRNAFLGKPISNIAKIKIGNAVRGAKNGHAHPILNRDTGEVFYSIMDAVRKYPSAFSSNIVRCCQGERKTAGGYHWQYFSD